MPHLMTRRRALCGLAATMNGIVGRTNFSKADTPEWAKTPRLRWRPPQQARPTVLQVPPSYWANDGLAGRLDRFADDQDILIIMPQVPRFGDLSVTGGRHIRIIGGDNGSRRLRFTDITGSVFIEGVKFSQMDRGRDCINVSSKKGSSPQYFFQNLIMSGVNGANSANHSDMIQFQGRCGGGIHIHRVTGDSNYQGFFLPMNRLLEKISYAEISMVNLSYTPLPGDPVTYLVWFSNTDQTGNDVVGHYPINLYEVYVSPRPGQNIAEHGVFPSTGQTIRGIDVGAISDQDGNVTWPKAMLIRGQVTSGVPAEGDFCTSAGVKYISPGYF